MNGEKIYILEGVVELVGFCFRPYKLLKSPPLAVDITRQPNPPVVSQILFQIQVGPVIRPTSLHNRNPLGLQCVTPRFYKRIIYFSF